ncbi:MAG: DUF2237 domain-containing protein [Akkermansiaceae bacterium]|jgi:uncharacterized protein|nr:DUF2237 domain-containing protein [Akkermansiaceae bacterium]
MPNLNVLGEELAVCSTEPMTGFFRDGCCRTGGGDHGLHCVCAVVTEDFLNFSRSQGNDLITPHPEFSFPGLEPGDSWCLCVQRWKEAHDHGCAPKVNLAATSVTALEFVDIDDLKKHAITSH